MQQESELRDYQFSSLNLNEIRFAIRRQTARNCRRNCISLEEAEADLQDPDLDEDTTESEDVEFSRPQRSTLSQRLTQRLDSVKEEPTKEEAKEEKIEKLEKLEKVEKQEVKSEVESDYTYESETEPDSEQAANPASSSKDAAPASSSANQAEASSANPAEASSSANRAEASSANQAEASSVRLTEASSVRRIESSSGSEGAFEESSTEERERLFLEGVPRPPYKTTDGLKTDASGRPLSPTGRPLSAGVDYPTPNTQARIDEEAWQLELAHNRKKNPPKRKKQKRR